MKWTREAEEALSRVPFFVRRRVRKRVEEEAVRCGASEVNMKHVQACREKFLRNMESEVKGFQVETCFGGGGCPNRAVTDGNLAGKLEGVLTGHRLREFLKERVQGPLKLHHEFRVSVSDCPNACSRPQIVDVGLIGASRPCITEEPCSQCGKCAEACKENAVRLDEGSESPVIDYEKCLFCGQCVSVCPTGTLGKEVEGYRILVGGKLGRHPQLARELAGIHSVGEVLCIVESILDHYKEHNRAGERLGEMLKRTGEDFFQTLDLSQCARRGG